MGRLSDPSRWNATDAEVAERFPCHDLLPGPLVEVTRAVDVRAPTARVFRWLCQLRVAPYSYDLVDNLGRRSPRRLTPGMGDLAEGQTVMRIFRLETYAVGEHLTLRGTDRCERLFGPLACTYAVRPLDDHSRLVCRLVLPSPESPPARLRQQALLWGDLAMMRRQLLVLKARAEETAPAG